MLKISKILCVPLIGLSIILLSGCGSKQKSGNIQSVEPTAEITAGFQKEQRELLATANQELSSINQKIRELNDKIKRKGGKLTDAQNESIDKFEEKRASVNKCMHQIKNISQEGWEDFKTTFENDLEEVKSSIDEILAGI